MEILADLHIHSKYSRATSPAMNVKELARFAKLKGITLLGTGDFTHPMWLAELKEKLTPAQNGLYAYEGINFMLTAEISNIFYVGGSAHQIHNIIFAPSFDAAEKINSKLERHGDLLSDGRPMLHLEASKLVELVRLADENCAVVPAHVWTPHFGLFGSNSGFDRIEDCFRDETKYIFALETGLSSDPAMNRRLSALDKFALISNSDSHSPSKLAREANVFDCEMSYFDILDALKKKDKKRFLYTIEFYPQEGKYHYDGHRKCNVSFSPAQTRKNKGICPACKRPLTVGVMNRVESLSDRPPGDLPENAIGFKNLIPLAEIIAEAFGKGVDSQAVEGEYLSLVAAHKSEFEILVKIPEGALMEKLPSKIAQGIIRARSGEVKIEPGCDGEYGKVKIFEDGADADKQLTLF